MGIHVGSVALCFSLDSGQSCSIASDCVLGILGRDVLEGTHVSTLEIHGIGSVI